MTSEELLARVSDLCLDLPETSTKLSHGAPSFMVAGKMFAYFSDDLHGDGRTAILLKTSGLEEQEMLLESDPTLYFRPPYIGHKGWIGLRLDLDEPDWDHVADRIAYSWELTAPRRLLEMGGR